MSTPRDGQEPNPFAPRPGDEPYGQPSSHPAPPPMASPYGAPLSNNEANTGGSTNRQPPRFPELNKPHELPSGAHAGLPPFVAPPAEGTGATIAPSAPTGSGWGSGKETFFLPPQFSYNPDQQQPVAPPPPPKKDRRKLIYGGAGAVAVVAAAAVVAGVMMTGSKPSPPATTAGPTGHLSSDIHTAQPAGTSTTPAWSVQAAQDPTTKTLIGSWLVDNHAVVRGDATGLQSYDAETGKQQWTYTVPGQAQGAAVCAMSQLAIAKIGIVQYGTKDNCTTVAAVNTDNGQQVWSNPIPGSGTAAMSSGGSVVVGTAGAGITVWNAADGQKLWDADLSKANPPCTLLQAGVKGVYAALVTDCGKGATLQMKDAHSGTDLWQAPVPPDGLTNARITLVAAAFPTIVHVESASGAPAFDRYYTFGDKGQAQPPFDGTGAFGKLDLKTAHVAGNTLVAATTKDADGKEPAASLVAIDLTTGKPLWQGPATTGAPVAIAALDANRVAVFDGGDKASGAKVLTLATAGGGPTGAGTTALGTDWAGPAMAYVAGDRLIVLPAEPEKGLAVLGFAVK